MEDTARLCVHTTSINPERMSLVVTPLESRIEIAIFKMLNQYEIFVSASRCVGH